MSFFSFFSTFCQIFAPTFLVSFHLVLPRERDIRLTYIGSAFSRSNHLRILIFAFIASQHAPAYRAWYYFTFVCPSVRLSISRMPVLCLNKCTYRLLHFFEDLVGVSFWFLSPTAVIKFQRELLNGGVEYTG